MKAHHKHSHSTEKSSSNTASSDLLDSLVSSGTINETQEKAIKSAFETAIKAYQDQATSYYDKNSITNSTDFTM